MTEEMLNSRKKIVVAGQICLDITPIFDNDVLNGDKWIGPGTLTPSEDVSVQIGGAVANTGLAMNLLGADVTLIGKIGNDEFGRLILNHLDEHHMNSDNTMVVAPNCVTGYAIIIEPGGDRAYIHCSGANDTLGTNDIDYAVVREADLFHFGYPPLMKRMYENDGDELVRLFQDVKALGVATSLDMSAADAANVSHVNWEVIMRRVMPYVDFFIPSAEELCSMLDKERYLEWKERAKGDDMMKYIDPVKDVKPLADLLIDKYHAKVVVIKCGCKGIYYKTADYHVMSEIGASALSNINLWSEKEDWVRAIRPEAIRSTNGVGDVTDATFLVTALMGMPIKDCARFAVAEAACSLEGYDARSTLRTIPELQKMYLQGI